MKENQWYEVEYLPFPTKGEFLVFIPKYNLGNGGMEIAVMLEDGKVYNTFGRQINWITHWMPLPQKPV